MIQGPLALAFLSLPLLGALSILALAFLLDPPVEPYEQVSERVQKLEWRDRYALAQLFLSHADGLGVGPIEAHLCVKEIADGKDLSLCMPARADRVETSVMLLEHMVAAMGHSAGLNPGLRNPAAGSPRFSKPEDSVPYGFSGEGDDFGPDDENEYEAGEEDCPAWNDPEFEGDGWSRPGHGSGAIEL